MVVSVNLLPLSSFLEHGQFAAVGVLIFFLRVSLSIAVVFSGRGGKDLFPFCNLSFSLVVVFKSHSILSHSKYHKGFE